LRRGKKSAARRVFDALNVLVILGLCFTILFPYVNVLAISLNDNAMAYGSGLMIFPAKPTLMNFRALFSDSNIVRASIVTVCRIVIGVLFNITTVYCASYALSKSYLPGRRKIVFFFLIPTYISGGLIPTYILYSRISLLNNPLVYVLPYAFSFFYFLLLRTYMTTTIPQSLEESAKLDGATDFTVMLRIYLPLCAPIIATILLFQTVDHWNDWTTTLYFMTNQKWNTLQFELQRVLREQSRLYQLLQAAITTGQVPPTNPSSTSSGLRNAQVIVTTLPIILVYPFLQRYFIQGLLIGGVKE
jgi:putative aldouronate transport system permease protein